MLSKAHLISIRIPLFSQLVAGASSSQRWENGAMNKRGGSNFTIQVPSVAEGTGEIGDASNHGCLQTPIKHTTLIDGHEDVVLCPLFQCVKSIAVWLSVSTLLSHLQQ